MSTSKVIKSIKTETYAWGVISQTDVGITFAYCMNPDWKFIRVSLNLGGGFVLKNDAEKVKMVWREEDTIASQLWGYLLSDLLK